MDETRHDADFALAGGDDTGAVRANEAGFALRFEDVGDADHVVLGDAFRDADDEGHFGGYSFFDAGSGQGWSVIL